MNPNTLIEKYPEFKGKLVGYFCAEYALSPTLPTYAGGLGILSGDYVREAAAQNFPLVSVGLRYRFAQSMLAAKNDDPEVNEEKSLHPVLDEKGKQILISIPLGGRMVSAAVFEWKEDKTSVYLLDSNVPENDQRDRDITKDLYTDIHIERLRQEILLGIGGFELLKTLGHSPSLYHLNEGHSAFLALALIKHHMENRQVDFKTACEYARRHIFFTNHTLVLEGQEQFTREMVRGQLESYVKKQMGVDIEEILDLGTPKNSAMFSMTTFAFHLSIKSNAVSAIHAKQASIVWPDDHPTDTVTNGIFIPRWDKIKDELVIGDQGLAMWTRHQQNKKNLLELIEKVTGEKWDENVLLFGWARRFVEYKQPLSFLKNIERLKKLAESQDRPFRIVYSGPTGGDVSGNPLVRELKKIISEQLPGLAVFLPNYNFSLAEQLVAGCDVWLNTPVIGREACGTSGMKAALNGALPLSTRDGWVAETDLSACGWTIDEPDINQKLLDAAEKEIIPLYYQNIQNPKNSAWIEKMKKSRNLIKEKFSMTRALQEYIEKLYLPILKQDFTQ